MNYFRIPVCLQLGLIILLASTIVGYAKSEEPDVVIILCDDFNPFYTGFSGDPDAQTPNLDALAEDSAVFTHCYATSTVCMPSRTSLITGLYPHNTGSWGNATDLFISSELMSMFRDFKSAGYTTSMIGKTHWFSGSSYKQQFSSIEDYFQALGIDEFKDVATTFGSRSGRGIYQDYLRESGLLEKQYEDLTERLSNNQYVARPSLLKPEQTCDWMMTSLALDYMRKVPREKPFAMMVGYSNPHSPFDPAGKYATMYDPERISLRKNVRTFKKYGTDYSLAEVRRARASYLGKISFLDDLVGQLISELKNRGTWDNTILVFTADQGLVVGEHGNISKGLFWEEITRVPLIMRIPGVTDGGMEVPALSQLIDICPTILDTIEAKVDPLNQGRSLLPVLQDSQVIVRDTVFSEICNQGSFNYMVRDERYKWFVREGTESLYDLETDPYELKNLIKSEKHQIIAEDFREHLRQFLMTEQINYGAGYKPLVQRVKGE